MAYKSMRSYVPLNQRKHRPTHYRGSPPPMEKQKMNLANTDNAKRFVAMLEKAEPHVGSVLDGWESTFVRDMRRHFETREDAIDLGQTPWSPTVNQWNTLHTIVSKL